MKKIKVINSADIEAVKEYLSRKNRSSHPEGSFDDAKRWYPSEYEKCDTCSSVRTPSRAHPFSIMKHCRSIGHIAAKRHVDASVMRKISGQVLRSAKEGADISVLEATRMIVDKDRYYDMESGILTNY